MLHEEITEVVLNAYYKVYNKLGYGFLEKVYENAMLIELKKSGVAAVAQKNIKVYYEGEEVGDYFADILVADKVIVELKSAKQLAAEHEAQLLNYLKATDIEVGLLINFGKEPEFTRKIFSNDNK